MRIFFRADVRQYALQLAQRHRVALIQIPHGGTEFTVRAAEFQKDTTGRGPLPCRLYYFLRGCLGILTDSASRSTTEADELP